MEGSGNMEQLLVVEQDLDGLNVLLADCMKKCVLRLDLMLDEQLDHLQVLVVDGHEERRPAEGVHAVDVDDSGLRCADEHPAGEGRIRRARQHGEKSEGKETKRGGGEKERRGRTDKMCQQPARKRDR